MRFAVLRQAKEIKWFACFGTQYPLGVRVHWVRSLLVNHGPICDDLAIWKAGVLELTERIRKEGYIHVDICSDWVDSCPEDTANLFEQTTWEQIAPARFSLRLDLTKANNTLLAAFRKNTRYEVRRAERFGVQVDFPKSDPEINEFLNLYLHMAERRGFTPNSPNHLQEIIQWLRIERDRGALLVASHEGTVLGGAVIVRAGKRCWYVWGATYKHQEFSVGHLIQWHALLWAKNHACTEYDFCGFTPGATSGPAWFKQGFGGSVVQFVPMHRQILRRAPYRLLNVILRGHEQTMLAWRTCAHQLRAS